MEVQDTDLSEIVKADLVTKEGEVIPLKNVNEEPTNIKKDFCGHVEWMAGKRSVLKNKSLKSQTQLLVMNVFKYFQEECENGGPFLPLKALNERTAAACGLTLHTVSMTKKRMKNARENNTLLNVPQKKHRRSKKKAADLEWD